MGYKYDEDTIAVNIVEMLQDHADAVPPAQWRTFLMYAEKCDVGRTQ